MLKIGSHRALFLLLALITAACTAPTVSPPAGSTTAGDEGLGGSVSVLATWTGEEQRAFAEMVKPFEQQTGVRVEYEGTRDINTVLVARVAGGNPPDVAGLPGPGQMAEFARTGALVDLSNVLDMSAMRAQYAEDWIKLAQVNGAQVGIFIKAALKGAIWHNPKELEKAGYKPPKSWNELMELSQRAAATGTAPWCMGLEAGAASGWPATDWLEDIVLRQAGPDVYDRWYRGQAKWSSPEIKKAWQTWGEIVAASGTVYGGRQGILATRFQEAGNPLFTSPPRCYLLHGGSFMTTFFQEANPQLKAGEDYTFFPFPTIDQKYAGATEVAGDLFGMFKDTPQARALIKYLTTPEAQSIWVRRGGAISPNKQVPLDAYPDAIARQAAQALTGAKIVRFDASDLMPEAMNTAFWRATLDYVNNPDSLDAILTNLDRVQAEAYRQ